MMNSIVKRQRDHQNLHRHGCLGIDIEMRCLGRAIAMATATATRCRLPRPLQIRDLVVGMTAKHRHEKGIVELVAHSFETDQLNGKVDNSMIFEDDTRE